MYIYTYIDIIYTLFILLEQISYQCYILSSFRKVGRGFLVKKLERKKEAMSLKGDLHLRRPITEQHKQ